MKKYFFIILSLLCFSCIKTTAPQEVRTFGAIKDDPARLAKVHVLMSASYYRTIPDKKKGKPPVDTTVITTPPPVYSGGYQIVMPPVTSQGYEGSCVPFALGYYTRSAEDYYQRGATTYSYSNNILSPEYLFDQIKTDISCYGSTVLDALDLMTSNGICTWQSMPYSDNNGCSLIPTAKQNIEAANYKISSYKIVYTSDQAMVKYLLDNKHPLVFTFNVDSYFYNATPGFIWKNFSGTNIGGHCVAICGYDDSRHAWKIINSWGTSWGDAGYSWIDYDFLPQVSTLALTLII